LFCPPNIKLKPVGIQSHDVSLIQREGEKKSLGRPFHLPTMRLVISQSTLNNSSLCRAVNILVKYSKHQAKTNSSFEIFTHLEI
jgi:hypothetical protein